MKRHLLAFIGLILLSCRTDSVVYPVEPRIELISFTPTEVPEYGTLQLRLAYRDGDGDLGGKPDGQADLFLIDMRDSTRFPSGYDGLIRYNMPRFYEGPLPQSIQGTIEISIPGVIRLDPNNPREPIAFRVFILDRAGHSSDTLTTPTVYIVP